jgi:deoxyribose-phosphate aldolase
MPSVLDLAKMIDHSLLHPTITDEQIRAGLADAHLALMRKHSGPNVQIKAAGGVRTLDDLLRVRALGVTRIGATATEAILAEAMRRGFPNRKLAGR